MRLLVLGGTVFLSRAVAEEGVRRGHEVVCACRGESGSVPEGARLVVADRAAGLPAELTEASWDAVVDVARTPSWVRSAVAGVPDAHWVFVSTVNVYSDESTPGGGPGTLPLREAQPDDVAPSDDGDPDAYGRMKVACEDLVRQGAASATIVRPGLIVGPGDPTGRYSYWPRRLAAGGEVLAPGDPADVVQIIDVRDLAAWIVSLAESRQTGDLDGVGEPMPIVDLLDRALAGVSPPVPTSLTWVPTAFLVEHGVDPWSGEESVPLWLPRPEYDGMLAHDVRPLLHAGLALRPIGDTTRDTLAWLDGAPTGERPVTGIGPDRERAVLDAWHARGDA